MARAYSQDLRDRVRFMGDTLLRLGTGGAALRPGPDQGSELLLRSRSGSPSGSGIPAPTHQRIFGHVVNDLVQALSTVPIGVLDLGADLAE